MSFTAPTKFLTAPCTNAAIDTFLTTISEKLTKKRKLFSSRCKKNRIKTLNIALAR